MKKHIAIIEDDTFLLELMCGLLQENGYETTGLTQLNNFEELVALNADCFIIDEQLPCVNGHIIGIMLKRKPETCRIPVILISGYDELEGFASLCQANAYLKKPFAHPDLLADIAKVVMKQHDFIAP